MRSKEDHLVWKENKNQVHDPTVWTLSQIWKGLWRNMVGVPNQITTWILVGLSSRVDDPDNPFPLHTKVTSQPGDGGSPYQLTEKSLDDCFRLLFRLCLLLSRFPSFN